MAKNLFAESKCDVAMWFGKNMLDRNKNLTVGLAKRLFRGKKYIATKSNGMITMAGWRKTNGEK